MFISSLNTFYINLVVRILLIVGGFLVSPVGIIDGSPPPSRLYLIEGSYVCNKTILLVTLGYERNLL